MKQFDVVIIGSGIGGLICGAILSKHGYSVCVLEKNKQIGGSLQTFVREKIIFDSGVHYLGGLDKGQNLYQIFKYIGLMDTLKLEKMDETAFDLIIMDHDDKAYPMAQGYDLFIETLNKDFPEERLAIETYCNKIREVCSKFPMYNLRTEGSVDDKKAVQTIGARDVIASLTTNRKLQEVLGGNNILYAGRGDQTPFYLHALIVNSYIESSWKCLDGGSQISKGLAKIIRKNGGIINSRTEVTQIVVNEELAVSVQTTDGKVFSGKTFISNIHPVKTLEMTETDLIRSAYRKRLTSLENSVSAFSVYIVLKKNSFPYIKHNYYYHEQGYLWNMDDYKEENWPLGYAFFVPAFSNQNGFAEAITIFAYMKFSEVAEWADTFNTATSEAERGTAYEEFKKRKAEVLLNKVEQKFPGLKASIKNYYTSSPLSYRDYIGTDDGSMYGIAKDYKDPLKTTVFPKTKITNLHFTGQNINIHGVLGSAISALLTCLDYPGTENLMENIRNA